ncbi:MAG: cytochrome c4 [Burkholderiales bacterium]|nr:cytochrome c4 [Burkholderiales bacterium]
MKKTSLATLAALLAAGSMAVSTAASAQDAKAGEKKVAMCIGCHNIPGYQASFPEIYKVPKIAGQNAKYIVSALNAYKKGDRKHPSMRAIATTLSDQDMADVAAYYEQLEKSAPAPAAPGEAPAEIAKLLAKANCESCHGKNYSMPIDPSYPKLAGQYADYLYVALKAYQTDHNPRVGRNNAIMMGMARPFTHAEIKALSKYLSSLPGELKSVQLPEFR